MRCIPRVPVLCAVALLAGVASTVQACATPVFQYALEKWPSSPYSILVCHRGPLDAEQQKALGALKECGTASGNGYANFTLQAVDLNTEKQEEVLQIWSRHSSLALPAVVLRYPDLPSGAPSAWSGPLSLQTVRQLVNSPARSEIVKRLQAGDAAVWVLLESGSDERNKAALDLLNKVLPQQKHTVTLAPEEDAPDFNKFFQPNPPGQPDQPAQTEKPKAGKELTIAFSLLRVSPSDPAEAVFVEMLRGIQAPEAGQPAVYPVFGQGRALNGLTGGDLTPEALDSSCQFVCGPCSCQVKAQNPGRDLLLWAKWANLDAGEAAGGQPKLPPLVGPTHLTGVASPAQHLSSAPAVPAATVAAPAGSYWLRNALWTAGVAVALIILGALVLSSHMRKE